MSDVWTVWVLAWEMPAPNRAQKNKKMFVATPEAKIIRPKNIVAKPTIGPRRRRSASQPIGTIPRTRNPPEIPVTNTITPELTWSDAWMFGERVASPELWRLSSATMNARIVKVRAPFLFRPSRSGICSSRVPGRSACGRMTSSCLSAFSRSTELSTTA